jgi:hypothetical protein
MNFEPLRPSGKWVTSGHGTSLLGELVSLKRLATITCLTTCDILPQQLQQLIPDWWFGTFGLFLHSVGNFTIPTDFQSIIFQRGGEKPPTSMTSMTTLRIPIAKFIASDHEKPTVAGDPIHTGRSWSRLR